MNVLVTGGCGQVGSHVIELLLERGDKVLAIDNLATGRREHLADHPNLEVVIDTISDKELIDSIFLKFKPDVVVHTAASYKDPNDWYNDTLTNCVGGSNVIMASKENNVKRFIYFQTALCYGVKPLQQPIQLNHPKFPASSSYAITKTANEDFLEISGLDFVTFRLANVVGPRNVSGPLPIFFQRLKTGKQCFVTKAKRDFVFVKDLAKVVIKACDGIGNGAYHFSSGTDIEIKALYDEVVKAMGFVDYPQPEIKSLSADDAGSILLDPSKTFEDFGKVQFTPIEETVKSAIEYFKEYGVHGEYTHLKIEKK
jgi:UDP-glucose 4-epimerase